MTKKKSAKSHRSKQRSHAHKGHSHAKHAHKRSKKPKTNLVMGLVVFVVLVAIVYGIIVLLSKAGTVRGDDVAAMVNDEPITVAQLDEQYDRIPAEYRSFITKMTLLNQTINEVVLLQAADAEGIDVTEEEVKAQIEEAMGQAGVSDGELEEKLAEQNLTRKFLYDLYGKQLKINKLLEQTIFEEISVTESEIEEYYYSGIRAAHILVEDESEAKRIILDLQRTSSSMLYEEFFAMAEERSIDPSAATNKGDLGEFSKGMMVPEFEEAAFALEEGEFTIKPVKTDFGYHIILRLPKEKALVEQAPEIEDFLLTQKKSAAVPLYVAQLVKKAHIQVFYEEPAEEE